MHDKVYSASLVIKKITFFDFVPIVLDYFVLESKIGQNIEMINNLSENNWHRYYVIFFYLHQNLRD